MAKLCQEARMTIKTLNEKGVSGRETARLLGVSEGAVRYHRRRQEAGAVDGRSLQRRQAERFGQAIEEWVSAHGGQAPRNVAALYDWLVGEFGYAHSLRSVQRYVRDRYAPPPVRARRRVETPPGAQAQADWAHYPRVWMGGRQRSLLAFTMQLSWSRYAVTVWCERKHTLAWLSAHNEAFRRLGGIPATVRVDNEKTVVIHGAGAFGVINPAYRRYAEALRFHIDACPPREPWTKGKIERRIGDHRGALDPYGRHWEDLAELQAVSDERRVHLSRRRQCPVTGTDVESAWQQELAHLAPVPVLPEPFDLVAERRVTVDCLVAFENHLYSVPFRFCGRCVEVRGCADSVQCLADGAVIARHPRHTPYRLVIDPSHFEGPSTAEVIAPPPLGRLGARLQAIAAMAPERRPVDLYAALAEVAR